MEKSLKDNLKTISDRGDERTRESLDTIKAAMLKNKSEDTVVKPRRNEQRNTIKVDERVNYKWDKVNFKEEWFGKTLKAKVIKVNSTNPNPIVRKSGAVGKAVLAQDPCFNGAKSSFF